MIRKAFLMKLKPGCEVEYHHRHNPIWPELEDTLRSHGAHNYSIFLDRRNGDLFGYVEIESEERWQAIAGTEVCQRWWVSMRGLMLTNDDASPVSLPLEEVFHLTETADTETANIETRP